MASFTLKVLVIAGAEIALQTLFSSIALIAVLSFGCPALHLALTGSTLLEYHFPMKEYVQIMPQVYCPLGPGFYRLRWFENMRDIIGPRWWLRLLPPVRGNLNIAGAVAPRPSPEGVAALRARMRQVQQEGVAHEVRSCEELGINPGPSNDETGQCV